MSTSIAAAPSIIDRVKRNLVDLKMPRALEILDVTLRGIERGEMTALDPGPALSAPRDVPTRLAPMPMSNWRLSSKSAQQPRIQPSGRCGELYRHIFQTPWSNLASMKRRSGALIAHFRARS